MHFVRILLGWKSQKPSPEIMVDVVASQAGRTGSSSLPVLGAQPFLWLNRMHQFLVRFCE